MTAATVLPYVLILAAALAALLVIALGANHDLIRENRELRADNRGKQVTIAQQAMSLASLKHLRSVGPSATPIGDMLQRRHDEFARDLARIHDLDEYRGDR